MVGREDESARQAGGADDRCRFGVGDRPAVQVVSEVDGHQDQVAEG